MIEYRRLGYEFTQDDDLECFENILLVYDDEELYWISCSNDVLRNPDEYFDEEVFVLGFSLQRRKNYNMIFATNIKYEDVLSDIRMNRIDKKLKVMFSERDYSKYLQFKIISETFKDAVIQLKAHLSTLKVEVV